MSQKRLVILLLILITIALYWPVAGFGFVNFDDGNYVADNRVVQDGLTFIGLKWAFTVMYAANWHPLTWLSHMLDCELFGVNAGAHHLVNVLIHAVNSALLFNLWFRLTGRQWSSALVAALFAWHPLHVESVAWISERKDVLSTFFGLLALMSYERYTRMGSWRGYWMSLIFFGLGLLAKPMLVTWPFVLLLLDCWPLGRIRLEALATRKVIPMLTEKIPFFALTLGSCIVTLFAQHAAVITLENLPFRYRLINAIDAIKNYVLKLLWPENFSILYPFSKISVPVWSTTTTILILVSIAAWMLRKRSPCVLIGWLWFFGTLMPVIGLLQVGSASMADRYSYIPSIGLFTAVIFGLDQLAFSRPWLQRLLAVVAVLACVTCLGVTRRQVYVWADSEALFRHAVTVTFNNDLAHSDLATVLERQERYDEALDEYRLAAGMNPHQWLYRISIGNMLLKLGQPDLALAEFHQCLGRDIKQAPVHDAIGCALAAQTNYPAALAEFQQAKQIDTNFPKPYISTAKVKLLQRDPTNAMLELRAAVQVAPFTRDVLCDVAQILASSSDDAIRDGPGAVELAAKAMESSDDPQPEVLDVMAMAYAETGNFTNAVNCAEAALELARTMKKRNAGEFQFRLELYRAGRPWRDTNLLNEW
jgi:tetratricopeptide (TPR) repeat protein